MICSREVYKSISLCMAVQSYYGGFGLSEAQEGSDQQSSDSKRVFGYVLETSILTTSRNLTIHVIKVQCR